MKYELEITINKPREEVIKIFDNQDNLSKWQKSLMSYDQISGTPREQGAKCKLLYDMNGRKTEMIETITSKNLPHQVTSTYDTKGVHNIQENYFYEEGADKTKWKTVSEFQFSGFMKIIGFLFQKSFPKTSYGFMEDFKEYAEKS